MNSVLEAIKNRRSVRLYESKPVPKDVLKAIIEAGNQAPFTSMTRAQPWRFVVVENPEFRQKLFETAFPVWKQSIEGMKQVAPDLYEMAMSIHDALDEPKDPVYYSAPAIVFVIGPEGSAVSCALACENMMIAAQSLGVGSCYVGFGAMVKANPEVASEFELKEKEEIHGPILLGYPKANPNPAQASAFEAIQPNKQNPTTKWV
ncbi:MAG: nitroreductase family protein [Candidatus Bathyarchaeota archaeon]|nr:nitroreductase family protein [Candidatus Bathyarchaeota archaeon]